ncbi:MAG TPA: hypothetical protein VL173_13785 [Vicinamibacterales bacterium]|nr:hypothetical protein [Vicinamibacterales bacterium]
MADRADDHFDDNHAQIVHPLRALIQNHCYLDAFIDKGGMSLVLMDGLILVPIIMFAFFYPIEVLSWVGGVLLFVAAIYESCVLWKRWHPQGS